MVSLTFATSSTRTLRPSPSGICKAAISATSLTAPNVRMDCTAPPISPRPPEASCWTRLIWFDTSLAVTPKPAMSAGSRSIWISRLTPPIRLTPPTPLVANNRFATSLSTNHDKSFSSILGEAIVKVKIGLPAVLIFETVGGIIALGKFARTLSTAFLTSFCATSLSFSTLNSTLIIAAPSVRLV